MKIKHSKYRNTGILFELLTRQLTSDTIAGVQSKALFILKKYFNSKTELLKEYKIYHTLSTKKFKTDNNENFLFPDAVILTEENSSINDYMLHIQREVGLNPRYLNQDEVIKLRNMEEEKYRRSLV